MPVCYTIDEPRRCIVLDVYGDVTEGELRQYHQEIGQQWRWRGYHLLGRIDDAARFRIPSISVFFAAFASLVAVNLAHAPVSRSALVAPSAASFGLMRMFQTYLELAGHVQEVQVFHTEETAWSWLEEEEAREAVPEPC
jgi:hypothetical protein